MRLVLGGLIGCALVAAVAALVAGFGGALHPAGDSLAVFRGVLSVAALAFAAALAALGFRQAAMLGAAVPALALASLAPDRIGWPGAEAAPPGLVLYQKNLWVGLADPALLVADIRASGADVVTLQEVHARNLPVIEALADAFPTQVVCPRSRVGGVAVLARWPAVAGSAVCAEGRGLVAVTLDAPGGEVTVASVHLHWPWPHGQPRQVECLEPVIAALPGPVVIGGDFNMVRWSSALRRIGAAARAAPVGRTRVTFPLGPGGLAGLSIDHVLAPGGAGDARLRPLLGSDHRGIVARVPLTPRP